MCKFSYYVNDRLYCEITKQICLYSKYCTKQGKYIHREGVDDCYIMKENTKKVIPKNAYKVRMVRKGYVYIEVADEVIKLENTLGTDDLEYVYMECKNGKYTISTEPIIHRKTSRRKINVEA